jgi:hypothetical protein
MNRVGGSLLHVVIVAGLTALALYAIRKSGERRRPAEHGPERGRISPGLISTLLMMVAMLLLLALGIGAFLTSSNVAGAILVVVALAGTMLMAPSLTRLHDVTWDSDGITGPDRVLWLTLGWTKIHIGWADIADTGVTRSRYDYVESRYGTRIYWSYLYPGHGYLTEAIAAHRARAPRGQLA